MPPVSVTNAPMLGKSTDQTGDVIGQTSTSPGWILSNSSSLGLEPSYEAACLGEMTADSVNWLWGDLLALGKVTLLTGVSGVGKSFVALRMAAAVTRGERDSRAETREEPAHALLISPVVELADVVQTTSANLARNDL